MFVHGVGHPVARLATGVFAALLSASPPVMAENSDFAIRFAGVKKQATALKSLMGKMSPTQAQALSGAAQNLATLADRVPDAVEGAPVREKKLVKSPIPAFSKLAQLTEDSTLVPEESVPGLAQVSSPTTDTDYASLGGFTQSETSTAWCGNNVVVGFNDSGSALESQFGIPPRLRQGMSFIGYARSTNQGRTFVDMGYLYPGANGYNFLGGDPVVACSDQNTFYFASLFSGSPEESSISISKSADGGTTFGEPVAAVTKPSYTHFLDKHWMTVDPIQPNRLYISYTDFDMSFSSPDCWDVRTAIELVHSEDSGATWSQPIVLAEICSSLGFVQGSQMVAGLNGEVFVTWEFNADGLKRNIQFSRSTDGGASFEAAINVADVTSVGSGAETYVYGHGIFQGGFRTAMEFPSLAIDRSAQPSAGSLYLVWSDGSLVVNDKVAETYGYADVLMSRSTDGGLSWSTPARVNQNPEPLANGLGTDQYQPGVAVDPTSGTVGVCFYDRRHDSANFLIDRYCTKSADSGASWTEMRITASSFTPVVGQDFLINPIYMGDYDQLATDVTGGSSGFVGAFGDSRRGNPDVWAARF